MEKAYHEKSKEIKICFISGVFDGGDFRDFVICYI